VYVGKSVTLKKRVLSHFQSTSPKEIKISQQVHHVETIPTGSELAALLLESKLIKELKPLYNHMLRRVSMYAMLVKKEQDGYSNLAVVSGNVDNETDLNTIYGVYSNRMKAKKTIVELTNTCQLCPKLMGIEKAKGACFSYSLGRCKGACIGKEAAPSYNLRFETALEQSKLSEWPFSGSIIIPVNDTGETVVINNWIIQGFNDENGDKLIIDAEPNFELDEYKIIRRFIKENRGQIIVAT
jgi:DNA polymerase-3 subunit epsilon